MCEITLQIYHELSAVANNCEETCKTGKQFIIVCEVPGLHHARMGTENIQSRIMIKKELN